jgi:hypothetical protein
MSCRERRDLIFLHAADVLEDVERSELEAHLATGCPHCNQALAEEREQLAGLALSLAPVVPPTRVREQLLARARERGARESQPRARRAPRQPRLRLAPGRAAALAGVALGAAALGFGAARWQLGAPSGDEVAALAPAAPAAEDAALELEALREQIAEQDDELAGLEAQLDSAGEITKLLAARQLDVLDLAAAEAGSEAWGRAFWDPDYHCYFRARGLPPLAGEQHYVLWMIGAGDRLHPAGTLEPDARGDFVIYTRLPRELSPISRSFVTAESEPPGEQPAGPTLLLGESPRSG